MKKKLVLKPVKGKGFVGRWDNELGWGMPDYINYELGARAESPNTFFRPHLKGEKFYLCEITIKPLKRKDGRYIVKKL